MKTQRNPKLWIVVAAGVCLLAVSVADAGIFVRSGKGGKYVGSRLGARPDQGASSIWKQLGLPEAQDPLNPRGYSNGDLWPAIAESTVMPRHPWVVWSRFNGENYDLAWSRWTGRSWEKIRWLAQSKNADELDADLTFNYRGQPFVVWWREQAGVGSVYLSLFMDGKWIDPYRISPAGVDSRFPTVDVFGEGKLVVRFSQPHGRYLQQVLFRQPTSITDDIDPRSYIKLQGDAVEIHGGR